MKPEATGLDRLVFTEDEQRHPLFKRLVLAIKEEREMLRDSLEFPSKIEETTLLRGQLLLLNRISAATSEVGPESRQSEANSPESASPALAAERFPLEFEN